MSDVPPDRLSNDPSSKFYNEELLRRGVGIRFKGVEKTNVEEYCVSEGNRDGRAVFPGCADGVA